MYISCNNLMQFLLDSFLIHIKLLNDKVKYIWGVISFWTSLQVWCAVLNLPYRASLVFFVGDHWGGCLRERIEKIEPKNTRK